MKKFGMAVVATLAPLLAVASKPLVSGSPKDNHQTVEPTPVVSSDPSKNQQTVKCAAAASPVEVTVSMPDSTVVVECQSTSQFDPTVVEHAQQTVYDNAACLEPKKLSTVCPSLSIEALKKDKEASETTGATLTIKTLPPAKPEVCFVQCKQPAAQRTAQACVVKVTIDQAPQGQAGAAGQGQVHVCAPPGGSISLSVPDKDSSVQFKCTEGFILYPSDSKRVFKDDCRTEENLKDMTRTETTAAPSGAGTRGGEASAASPITYTLRADKKPRKNRLCYLCAKQKASDTTAKPAENYCAVYIESSAGTKFGLGVAPWALVLTYVPTMLRFP